MHHHNGIGVVLAHRMSDGSERPISFASRTLAPAEKQYSQLEKEALSVAWGVKKFHSYLFGRHFVINNDHKPLEGLLREDKPVRPMGSGRIQRWALALSAYVYTFKYKSGEKMGNADAISRLPLSHEPADVPMPADVVCLLEFIDPSPIDVGMIKHWTDKDAILSRVRRFVSLGWPASIGDDAELISYFCRQEELSVQSGCILWGARVVVPLKAREIVIDMIHDLEYKVQRCVACQSKRHSPAKAPLHPWEYPKRPWSRIHVDYAGPYQGKMLLVIVDAFTKWLEVHVMNLSTAEATVEKLRTTFATFGIPETAVSDNGTCFVSEVFQTFMSRNGIRHIKVAPKHPASNGLAERSVQSVKECLNKMTTGSLETKLARFLFKYRNIPHSTTGKSPTELLFGRKVRTHLDHLHPDEAKAVEEQQLKQRVYHDRHAKDRQANVGDPVYVTNFSSGPCWLPGVVVNKSGPVSFIVKLLDDRTVRRHQYHVRARRAQHFPEREVYADVSEIPIVGVVPAI